MIVFFLAAFALLNSCLKDNVGVDWGPSVKGKMYAEINTMYVGFQTTALEPVPDPVIFKFLVNIASDEPPAEDITVTLWADTAAMDSYNSSKGTNYKLYPYIQILDSNLVIKAGTRNAYAHVKVWNANLLNACDNYMAPIAIKAATGGVIPADPMNMGAIFMGLPIANPYAGSFHCVGYRKYPTAGTLTVDKDEDLSTVNCSTVIKTQVGDYPYDCQIQVTTTPMTVLGVTCYKVLVTVIDPSTGSPVASGQGMESTYTGDPSALPTPPSIDVNYYNPVTKQFVLNYYYNSAAPCIMYEILTRNN